MQQADSFYIFKAAGLLPTVGRRSGTDMCVALPGRVVSVEGTTAAVDFQGNTVRAEAGLVRVKPGDQVLVHAGCILQVLSETEGRQLRELFEELEEAAGEGNN